ncbi:MAG: HDIG domain-containing protein [Thermovirgaceae bacterium]|nr:HDIG domain-containing protein [Thermovirgaceae bacterium]
MGVTRDDAMKLLREHNKEINHIRHALAVEAAMRHFAKVNGGDEDLWGLAGLIHDVDWETTREDYSRHTHVGAGWLKEAGYPDEIVRAVLAHGWGICSDVEPLTAMEKHLYAIDELTGFVTAVALVRPGKSLQDLTVKSVNKKWKDKAFARGVDRAVIEKGKAILDTQLEDLIDGVITALKPIEREIGLGEGN